MATKPQGGEGRCGSVSVSPGPFELLLEHCRHPIKARGAAMGLAQGHPDEAHTTSGIEKPRSTGSLEMV